ncbi:MAG: adenylosuccinate synthase [SAR324 cluster bacterium]|nr:adenylosuccinate synthase [SAR324 cluster bacterium]
MTCVVIVGCQWGDEGKGKIVDLLTEHADIVARFQGGNNAGHTVVFDNRTYILHLIPSGIFRKGKLAVLGNGVVVDPIALLEEIDGLQAKGVTVGDNLRISDEANLIMPYHKAMDKLRETLKGAGKIGTTGRGIGPAYEDKMARGGVRFSDFRGNGRKDLCGRLKSIIEEKNVLMRSHFHTDAFFDVGEIYDQYAALYQRIMPYLCDTSVLLNEAIDAGKAVLFEGAQGTHLDVDHGTYPYVTSSSTLAGGACTGCGVGPTKITDVIGVAKAYTTRVGEGPFPTELTGQAVGELLQKRGQEIGATTGRVRRCGWFDVPLVREAVRLNGMTGLAITKLDVLDTLEHIEIAVGYRDREGEILTSMPHHAGAAAELVPEYEELAGWESSTRGLTKLSALPKAARRYLDRISELTGAPVVLISTGPSREETIVVESVF